MTKRRSEIWCSFHQWEATLFAKNPTIPGGKDESPLGRWIQKDRMRPICDMFGVGCERQAIGRAQPFYAEFGTTSAADAPLDPHKGDLRSQT